MTHRNKAIRQGALVQALIVGIEKRLADGKALALSAGLPNVVDKITLAEAAAVDLHEKLNDLAGALLNAVGDSGDDITTFSGGDDKPPPPDGGN